MIKRVIAIFMIVITIIIIILIIVNAFEYQYYNMYEDNRVIVLIHSSFPLLKINVLCMIPVNTTNIESILRRLK